MLTGMLAAELRVKNAVSPLSFQAAKHKWVWVLTKADKCNQWIHNKCHEEHGSDQYADQTSVSEKNVESPARRL